jgi:hypothetical protein
MRTSDSFGVAEHVATKFDQKLIAFVKGDLALSMACARFARTFADSGNLEGATRELTKARNAYCDAQKLMREIADIGMEDRRSIENEMAALERLIDLLEG